MAARAIGVFLSFGFSWEAGTKIPTKEKDNNMRYLDAFSHLLSEKDF